MTTTELLQGSLSAHAAEGHRQPAPGSSGSTARRDVDPPPVVYVLLADHDPISRRVLSVLLDEAPGIRLVGSVDSRSDTADWPLHDIDVVVLCVGPQDDLRESLEPLTAVKSQVLLLGTCWDHERISTAFALGARGCLIKEALPTNLAAGARAVVANHCVLTPELLELYIGPGEATPARPMSSRSPADLMDYYKQRAMRIASLTAREREVLLHLTAGLSTEEVAAKICVSCSTVKSHISRALTKLDVRNRLEAVLLMQAAPPQVSADGCSPRATAGLRLNMSHQVEIS